MSGEGEPMDPQSPRFRRFAEWVIQFRWPSLVLIACLTAAAAFLVATRIQVNNSTEYFAAGDSDAKAVLEQFQADFGRDDLLFVVVEGDVFSPAFLDQLKSLHGAVERLEPNGVSEGADAPPTSPPTTADHSSSRSPFIAEVSSLINASEVVGGPGGLPALKGLLDPWPTAAQLPALRDKVTSDPLFAGNLVSRAGRHTVMAVRTATVDETVSDQLVIALRKVVDGHQSEGFTAFVTGTPALNQTLNAIAVEDMNRLVGLALLAMVIVLFLFFRSLVGVIPPILVVAIATVWTLGTMALSGTPLTLLTNVLPAFLVVVGLCDSIHVVSVWRDLRFRGRDSRQAAIEAIATTGVPVLFTSLTTAAGLGSFAFAHARATQEVGIIGAAGVMVAMVLSLVLLPILLSLWTRPPRGADGARRSDWLDGFLRVLTALSVSRRGRWRVAVVTAAVCVASGFGIAKLQIAHDPLKAFPPDSEIAGHFRTVDQHLGGSATASLVVETASEGGIRDLETLRGMADLEAWIRAYREPESGEVVVTQVLSVLDVVRQLNRAAMGGGGEHFVLPTSQEQVNRALLMAEVGASPALRRLVAQDYRRAQMTVRLKWQDASAYGPFRDYVERGVQQFLPPPTKVETTGTVFGVLTVLDTMVDDLATSFGTALITITLMMLVLLRRIRLGLLSLVANLVPIAVMLGFMGLSGIAMDLNNLLLASIVLGIAVDDTIHYLHQAQVGYGHGGTVEGAIAHAVGHSGRAMVGSTLVLVIGFSIYLASRLVSLQQFGLLVALACSVALLADLVLNPALLRAFGGGLFGKERPGTSGDRSA